MTRVAAIVLAAGGSSRMGRPKQLLPFRGKSLARHAVETALDAGCDSVIVVLGAAAERVAPELTGLPVTIVINFDWSDGPGTSVRAGIDAVLKSAESALFLLADQPFVDAVYLRRLFDAREASGLPMAASGYAGSAGVPAVFARECFPALLALDPAAGAKKVLARDPARVVVVPFPAGAIDFDTPADYERWATPSPVPDAEESHAARP